MILSEIKKYLMSRRAATLQDISLHLDVAPDAVRGMLEHWMRKGRVVRLLCPGVACSKACTNCDSTLMEIYQWKD